MGVKIRNEEEKFQLAIEICDISNRATTCSYHPHHHTNGSSKFINWYLVLKVNENAEIDAIRKQYHKLALQLHPDKNKHSKAETAFKLVSEAYFCLSNNARRAAFDSERKKNISCIKCNMILYPTSNPPKVYQETSRFDRVQRRMRELRNKLKDEAVIIEKCLMSNARASSVNANGIRTETPVFNPSDHQNKGYPHHRTINPNNLDNLRAYFMIGNRCLHTSSRNIESPIFQYGSERGCFVSRCASTRNQ
ncbi:hypothetical protein BUALT_Bualt12G0116800 [Buddleja alternifolia]|uniref:J domain-containing protein n=1 Tax=Buddleja alternifolia TaxID=168488 RepID=A0AAV6WXR6_9LAMI|nr:hypothetical protein BUALT_Bualt12G0116800 [Buddleja alternifolia]